MKNQIMRPQLRLALITGDLSPAIIGDVKILSAEDLGETIRTIVSISGYEFKRLKHKNQNIRTVWCDEDCVYSDVPILPDAIADKLETIYQAHCPQVVIIQKTKFSNP